MRTGQQGIDFDVVPAGPAASRELDRADAGERTQLRDHLIQRPIHENGCENPKLHRNVSLGFAHSIRFEGSKVKRMRRNFAKPRIAIAIPFAGENLSSQLIADKYRLEILPRLERAYKLLVEQYGQMTASFLRVLILERMLYENETAYVDALERAWTRSIALRGSLLAGSLGATSSGSSGAAGDAREAAPPNGEGNGVLGSLSGLGFRWSREFSPDARKEDMPAAVRSKPFCFMAASEL
jgi:hypothetical protein